MKIKYILIFCLTIQIFLTACNISEVYDETPLSRTEFMLGTMCNIKLYDKKSDEIMEKAFERIADIEKMLSSNLEDTEVDEINKCAGIKKVKVSEDTFEVIKKGLEYSEISEGSFDISIGALVGLWRTGYSDARVPEQSEINSVLHLINYENLELDETEQTVYLKESNMKLDLGAIAKGYAADEIAEVLKENGVKSAIIDLGGNVYVVGSKLGSQWVIGIQDPFDTRGSYVGTVKYTDKSLVTSGIYERYLEQDGVIYHHLLNPDDGYPFKNKIAGVTVISDNSTDGDALSTIAFSKDVVEGMNFIETLDNIEAIFITIDKEIYISDGLKDNFILTDYDYKLAKLQS